jgi:hypothetical protein
LNHVIVQNQTLRAGVCMDGVERAVSEPTDSDTQWTLEVEGAFVRGNRKLVCSSFEILTRQLATKGRTPHVFAFVRNESPNAAERAKARYTRLCKAHRDARSISTAMAKSAGNPVLDHRMCKRQQTHWSLWVARPLAQVQCAVANGGLGNRLTLFKHRRTSYQLGSLRALVRCLFA